MTHLPLSLKHCLLVNSVGTGTTHVKKAQSHGDKWTTKNIMNETKKMEYYRTAKRVVPPSITLFLYAR
jgi:hypothetical protein